MTGTETGRTRTTYPIVFIADVAELVVGAFDQPSATDGGSPVTAADGDVALRQVLERLRAGSRTDSTRCGTVPADPAGSDLPTS
jgi:hypothetical protein